MDSRLSTIRTNSSGGIDNGEIFSKIRQRGREKRGGLGTGAEEGRGRKGVVC